jgi:uncharacterized protein (TIGR02421 family)
MKDCPELRHAIHVDRELAAIAQSYSLLLAVTPTNTREAFSKFLEAGCEGEPEFEYRPKALCTVALKRRLYGIEVETVDDPDLAFLLDEKRKEIDREITLIEERNSWSFRYVGMQLYGVVERDLLSLAEGVLAGITPEEEDDETEPPIDAHAFQRAAQREIDAYRDEFEGFAGEAEVSDEALGLVVSKGKLLIGSETRIDAARVEAALHHEVGTHLLTYSNGKAQPLRLLATGLPNYDELQEGLAVLSEYLCGGLGHSRARTLAGRVVAVHAMTEGADFSDTFRHLAKECGFSRRLAFNIAMRVYRGGGLTKDAVYLRGLQRLLAYLTTGADFQELFLGKFSLHHVPHLRSLREKGILIEPAALPRYLRDPAARERLEAVRSGMSVLDLIGKRP